MMTRLRILSLVMMVSVLMSLAVPFSARAQVVPNPFADIPVTGAVPGVPGGLFTGTLDVTEFAVQDGQLVAIGNLTGTLTQTVEGVTTVVGTVTDVLVTLPVTDITGTCEILHLELGPLDLDLLGLVVHLDRVVLDVSAEAAPGNLLGNLLCAVAHLLDRPAAGLGQPQGLAALLNRILAVF